MNNEYRVWCANKKQWEQHEVLLDANGILFQYHKNCLIRFDSKTHIVEFYTGIKDKNQKKIYDGDILKGLHDFGPAGYHNLRFTVKYNKITGYQWNYWHIETLEIIGNIHENYDLILNNS